MAPTDIYIMDTWYGFALVASFKPGNGQGSSTLDERRKSARAHLDALNEEHRRWIHAGRWSKVPPMQAADPGEAVPSLKGKGA